MAGPNDCSDSTTKSIMQDMVEAVTEAKKVSSEVCILHIISRTDDGSSQLKVECQFGVDTICRHLSHHLCYHLSYSGSERFIKNFDIPATVNKFQRRPKKSSVGSSMGRSTRVGFLRKT